MNLLKSLASTVLSGKGNKAQLATAVMQNPRLMKAAMGLLDKDSPVGGLPGLVANFQSAGLGDTVASWLGSGENKPVSGGDIQKALGGSTLDSLAAQAKMTPSDASDVLADALPAMIDKVTPKGNVESLDMGQLQSMLGGFLNGKL